MLVPDLTSRYSHFGISLPKLNIEDIFNEVFGKKGEISTPKLEIKFAPIHKVFAAICLSDLTVDQGSFFVYIPVPKFS